MEADDYSGLLHSQSKLNFPTSANHDQARRRTSAAPPCNINGNFIDSLPPGFRFCPTKVELIKFYLLPKINKGILPPNNIRDVNLYQHGPDKITERYKTDENEEWYFFTPRDRKYPKGERPNRAAGAGYWKATGADERIEDEDNNYRIIGFKKSLVYFEGKAPHGKKSDWLMHEYRIHSNDNKRKDRTQFTMRLDDYVLCRIYKKDGRSLQRFRVREKEEVQAVATSFPRVKINDNPTNGTVHSSRLMINPYQNTCLNHSSGFFAPCASGVPLSMEYGMFSFHQDINMLMQQEDYMRYMQLSPEQLDNDLSYVDNFLVSVDDKDHLSLF